MSDRSRLAYLPEGLRLRCVPFVLRLRLSLPLFMLGIGADHSNNAAAVNDLAVITHFLNRCPDFHNCFPSCTERALGEESFAHKKRLVYHCPPAFATCLRGRPVAALADVPIAV